MWRLLFQMVPPASRVDVIFVSVRRYVLYRSVLVLHSSILYHGSNQTPMMAVDDTSVLAAELDAGALVAELFDEESGHST